MVVLLNWFWSHQRDRVKEMTQALNINLHYTPAGMTDSWQPLENFGLSKQQQEHYFGQKLVKVGTNKQLYRTSYKLGKDWVRIHSRRPGIDNIEILWLDCVHRMNYKTQILHPTWSSIIPHAWTISFWIPVKNFEFWNRYEISLVKSGIRYPETLINSHILHKTLVFACSGSVSVL